MCTSRVDSGLSDPAFKAAGPGLLARVIAELAYEDLLVPVPESDDWWGIELPAEVTYRFRARRGAFGSWRVDPSSLVRRVGTEEATGDDPLRFFLEARSALGLSGSVMAQIVRELTATQAADARLAAAALTAEELCDLPHEDLEGHQTGHPCLFLNKGRTGFSASDAATYAPEARQDLRLLWVAVTPRLASFQAVAGLSHDQLLAEELGADVVAEHGARLHGCDADDFVWVPVHPFQWDEVVQPLFAPQIASGDLVVLGDSPDRYRPLQSVRTLTNRTSPWRRNVKVPLMIRNTLVWRTLSPVQTTGAPHLTTWLQDLRDSDPFLRDECRVIMLGEVASATVRHPVLDELADAPYRFHGLLGAIWREPLETHLRAGERARTMAALLLEGRDERAFVSVLVERSRLAPRAWLRSLVGAVLPPLLHYLHRYGASFTPHGENVVLVFDEREVPTRIALKDFGADVEILPFDLPEYGAIPSDIRATLHRWSPEELAHSIMSAVFAGHFRFFAEIVERHLGVTEAEFWAIVRDEVVAYQHRFPELRTRFGWFNILGADFGRVCLNREQLFGGGFDDRADRDAAFDLIRGRVTNPLHLAADGRTPTPCP